MLLTTNEKFVIIYRNSINSDSKKPKRREFPRMWEQRTMKNIVRVICLLLACLFCLLAVSACDNNKNKKRNNGDANVRVDENGVRWAEDEWGTWREYDNLPDEEIDYNDKPISMLYWIGGEPEFEQNEEVDNEVLSAIYKRNMAIQDRLGVELVFTAEPGDNSNWKTFVARVQRARESGMHDFDIVAGYARASGALCVSGLVTNLSAIENSYIDLSKPWWPANIVGNLALDGNLYFTSGDMSTNTIYNMHAILFNKKLVNAQFQQEAEAYFAQNGHVKTAETASKENPEGGNSASNMIYEKVYAGKWTLDEFLAVCAGTYVDNSGDGITGDDTYGFSGNHFEMIPLYSGCNLRMLEPTTDGSILKISDDWTSAKTIKLIAKLNTLFSSNDFHNRWKTGTDRLKPFTNGKCYFVMSLLKVASENLVNSAKVTSYGILPSPKWDLNQKNYYTCLGNEFSLYSVFVDFDTRGDEQGTLTMLSAVLECWASEAFRKTTPVIFELSMKLKASPTQCEADMCEIVRSSIELDLGRVVGTALSGDVETIFQMDTQVIQAAIEGTPWSTVVNQNLSAIQANLESFINSLRSTMV